MNMSKVFPVPVCPLQALEQTGQDDGEEQRDDQSFGRNGKLIATRVGD